MKEKLMFQNAPHVRQSTSVLTMMTDVILALFPIYAMAFFYYGIRSVVLGLCGMFTCAVFSLLGEFLLKEKPRLDFASLITGLIIPLLLPANIPYYVVISACAVAIFVVKVPFGGTGYNLFNPAAVGFASVAICWPELVFNYPATMQTIEVFGESTAKIAQSPAYNLSLGIVPDSTVLDMLLGSAPGPMGATNIIVVVACGIFLVVRKNINWITPVSFLLPYAILCLLFPRVTCSAFDAICYELFSGTVIFGAFFMLAEPVTSPKSDLGKLMSGALSALVVFLFRYFGGFELGFANALIVMNVFSPIFDTISENIYRLYRHKEKMFSSLAVKSKDTKKSGDEKKPFVRTFQKKTKPISEESEKTVSAKENEKEAVLE